MADGELHEFGRQYLDRLVSGSAALTAEVASWQEEHNMADGAIDRLFTTRMCALYSHGSIRYFKSTEY